ncbi:CopG family ribbon-helix-helix protein [Candidatus Harpocratesius sp.]
MAEKRREYARFSVSVPNELNEEFEILRKKIHLSRSDAVRRGMRLLINANIEQITNAEDIEVLGTIAYIEKAHVHSLISKSSVTSHSQSKIKKNSQKDSKKDSELRYNHNHKLNNNNNNYNHHHHHDLDSQRIKEKSQISGEQYYFPVDQLEFIQINDLQHKFLEEIISTTHIHASREKCMILIAVKGRLTRINALMQELKSFKTIQNLQFLALEKYSIKNQNN